MKKVFLSLIILLITLAGSTQGLQDTIITKAGDTINCEITLVNDYNIFYQYKKKRRTKSEHISRELVLKYNSNKHEELSFDSNFKSKYIKCDTCENWVVTINDDTIYYDLFFYRLLDDRILIERIECISNNGIAYYDRFNIKSAKWNDIEYTRVSNQEKEIKYLSPDADLYPYAESLLGYYVVKGDISLIKVGKLDIIYFSNYLSKKIILEGYFLEIDNEIIYLLSGKRGLAYTLRKVFKDNPRILAKIKTEGIEVSEMIELFKAYNAEVEKTNQLTE